MQIEPHLIKPQFVGRVLGINAVIGFHGETVVDLRSDFEAAIDFMLNDCKVQGETPEIPASGKLMLRVPPEIHSAALVAAKVEGKSLNKMGSRYLG
ncbi:type II toxin-antitoxin system HicB family antitoxin [Crenothrix sp.]|uniref:type II toxin-antitoxin system HicB family antitoxin n=1 Tax=Crenothrix sp. TaxID=3100433 RepID=UPI00374CB806